MKIATLTKIVPIILTAALLTGVPTTVTADPLNLLKNGDFSECSKAPLPDNWEKWSWGDEGKTTYTASKNDNPAYVTLQGSDSDLRLIQKVTLEKDTIYCYSGEIKAGDFTIPENKGGVLSVLNHTTSTESVMNSNGWRYVEMYIKAEDTIEVSLSAGIGGHSSMNGGKASFRNLSLIKADSVKSGGVFLEIPVDSASGGGESSNTVVFILAGLGGLLAIALIGILVMNNKGTDTDSLDPLSDEDESEEGESEEGETPADDANKVAKNDTWDDD